MHIFVQFL